MKKIALLVPVLVFLDAGISARADAPIATQAAAYKPIAMTVDTLDNGLRVVVVPMAGAPTVAFYTLVMAGSRDEVEPGRSGYAHLFEHLMFRGTDKVPAADYEKKMQALGADNNAFTTDDYTFYVPLVPKDSLAELVPLEADRFEHLNVAPAPYKDETGAVAGEFDKDFSNPWWAMDEAIRELAFTRAHVRAHGDWLQTRRRSDAAKSRVLEDVLLALLRSGQLRDLRGGRRDRAKKFSSS